MQYNIVKFFIVDFLGGELRLKWGICCETAYAYDERWQDQCVMLSK